MLSVSFFVQQQRLAEMNLFWELITAFNGRYDKLNERLMRIRCEDDCTDYQVVWDYFNLCAEDFLFFPKGTWTREFGEHGVLACSITSKLSRSLLCGEM